MKYFTINKIIPRLMETFFSVKNDFPSWKKKLKELLLFM